VVFVDNASDALLLNDCETELVSAGGREVNYLKKSSLQDDLFSR